MTAHLIRFDVIEIDRDGGGTLLGRGFSDLRGPGWYWRLKGTNGRILAHSEVYEEKRNALDTIRSLVEGIRGMTGAGVEVVTVPLDGAESKARL